MQQQAGGGGARAGAPWAVDAAAWVAGEHAASLDDSETPARVKVLSATRSLKIVA